MYRDLRAWCLPAQINDYERIKRIFRRRAIGTLCARSSNSEDYVLQYWLDVEIHRSAHKHGIDDTAICHALEGMPSPFLISNQTPTHPRCLPSDPIPPGICWRSSGSNSEANLVIHAMPLGLQFYDLLPQSPEDMS